MKVEKAAKQLEALGNPTRLQVYRDWCARRCRPSRWAAAGEAEGPGLDALAPSALAHPDRSREQERQGTTLICRTNYPAMRGLLGFLADSAAPTASASRNRAGRRPDFLFGSSFDVSWNYGGRNGKMLESRRRATTRGPGTPERGRRASPALTIRVSAEPKGNRHDDRHPRSSRCGVGAGPVGLAVAAHLIERGVFGAVYEAVRRSRRVSANGAMCACSRRGDTTRPGAARAAPRLAGAAGGRLSDRRRSLRRLSEPLAATPEMAAVIETSRTVAAITPAGPRQGGRETDARQSRSSCSVANGRGALRRDLARAVIDASGTWTMPNPLGAGGLPAEGEAEHAGRIAYGCPTCSGATARPMRTCDLVSAPATRPRTCCSTS